MPGGRDGTPGAPAAGSAAQCQIGDSHPGLPVPPPPPTLRAPPPCSPRSLGPPRTPPCPLGRAAPAPAGRVPPAGADLCYPAVLQALLQLQLIVDCGRERPGGERRGGHGVAAPRPPVPTPAPARAQGGSPAGVYGGCWVARAVLGGCGRRWIPVGACPWPPAVCHHGPRPGGTRRAAPCHPTSRRQHGQDRPLWGPPLRAFGVCRHPAPLSEPPLLLPSTDWGQGTPGATSAPHRGPQPFLQPPAAPSLPPPQPRSARGCSHQPVHPGKVPPEVPCPVCCRHFFGINHDGVGLREGRAARGQRGSAAPGQGAGPAGWPAATPPPALTSRKREMSLLSLTPMATTFSKSQKKGRSSPSLGRASWSRR